MGRYVVFHLYGPLAAWGDIAIGEHRPTHAHPTRTAILGLVAGSLGIRREEEERLLELERDLRLAVMVLSPGDLLRDYHTAQAPGDNRSFATRREELQSERIHTILSSRDYRTDALYRIALWSEEKGPAKLNEIADALNTPIFTPYLGRKSCPLAIPCEARVVEARSPGQALRQGSHKLGNYLRKLVRGEGGWLVYHDQIGEQDPHLTHIQEVNKKDRLLSRRRWQFGNRIEHQSRAEVYDVFQ